jgi:hypothetical protein
VQDERREQPLSEAKKKRLWKRIAGLGLILTVIKVKLPKITECRLCFIAAVLGFSIFFSYERFGLVWSYAISPSYQQCAESATPGIVDSGESIFYHEYFSEL